MSMQPRIYQSLLEEHLTKDRQMIFLVGPRQCGKTTLSRMLANSDAYHVFYFNWDNPEHRHVIIEGPGAVMRFMNASELSEKSLLVIFDEIHKYRQWKSWIKGFYDTYSESVHVVVTGSAKLNTYKKGGDSLMGRYFLYRMHPLSVAECVRTHREDVPVVSPTRIAEDDWNHLVDYGGFPEPFLKHNLKFSAKWNQLRFDQLIREDIRDLTAIRDLAEIEMLAKLLQQQSSQLMTYHSLAKKVRVGGDTIKRWIEVLNSLYYCFLIKPWQKNVARSLIKEPKAYLWDWSLVQDRGSRYENLVAVHLLKAVHFWTDCGLGRFDLYFVRDKDGSEVDFVVTRDEKPWFLVEVKSSRKESLSSALVHFAEKLNVSHAFQVVFDMDYVDKDCFSVRTPVIVPASTFLSQLI